MKKICILLCFLFVGYVFAFNAQNQVIKAESKTVYLTFDDGPSQNTTKILEILKKNKINATFFVIGQNAENYKELTKKIIAYGNEIGIHTQTHDYKKIYKDEKSLYEDILECKNTLKKILPNYTVKAYRFPGGSFNLSEKLKKVPQAFNLTYYDWNASCRDCELKDYTPQDLIDSCITTSCHKNKIILLMHDAPNKYRSVTALQGIIDYYKNSGYVFNKISEK